MKKFIAAIAIAAISSVAYGQVSDQGHVSIVDGNINITPAEGVWDGTGLAGIEATSAGGHLSLQSQDFGPPVGVIKFTTPLTGGSVVEDTPNSVVIGVLGAENRVTISGTTATAIGYAGDNPGNGDPTAGGDLVVNLGIGDSGPVAFPVVPEPATGLMAAFGLVGLLGLRRRR